jgi:hypothetical protein
MTGPGARPRRRPGVLLIALGLLLLAGDLGLVAFDAAAGIPSADRKPVVGQLAAVGGSPALGRLPLLSPVAAAGLAGLLAALVLAAAIGVLRRRRSAWVTVMLLAAALLTVNLVAAVVDTADHLTMALAVLTVFYLNRRDVQRAFEPHAGSARHAGSGEA